MQHLAAEMSVLTFRGLAACVRLYMVSVGHDREPYKTAEPTEMPCGLGKPGWTQEPCIRWGPNRTAKRGNVRGFPAH